MKTTHLFARNWEGDLNHVEYLASEMAEVFTPKQIADLKAGKTVTTGEGCSELEWVEAEVLARKALKVNREETVRRLRAHERKMLVKRYGERSRTLMNFDARTADALRNARKLDKAGL